MHRVIENSAQCLSLRQCGLALLLAVAVAGCGGGPKGPQRMKIQGAVKVGGQTLTDGAIQFIPGESTQGPAASAAIKDGAYVVPAAQGPVKGTYQVKIEAGMDPSLASLAEDPVALAAYIKQHGGLPRTARIPARYNRQTTLVVDVRSDRGNTFDFDLEPEPPAPKGR